MKIPVGALFDLFGGSGRASRPESRDVVRLSVMVVGGTSSAMVGAARAGLWPRTAAGRIHVKGVGKDDPARTGVNVLSDAALVLVGPGSSPGDAARLWRDFASVGVPCLVAGQAPADDAADLSCALTALGVPDERCYVGGQAEAVMAWAGGRLADLLPECTADVAARNFPCVRRARAREVVSKSCAANAAVAVGGLVPLVGSGADIAAMTAVQLSMAGGMADLYQVDDMLERTVEGAALVAAAPLWRLLARGLSRALPLPPVLVRVAVAAAGTYLGGAGLAAYHEGGVAREREGRPSGAARWIRSRMGGAAAGRGRG